MRHAARPLMVFAAGFGTRMRPLTNDRPKPLVPVAGRALLDHALALAGARRVVVNAHYHAEQIAAHLVPRPDIALRIERPQILDTGGGLRAARHVLGAGPWLTLNSDAVWRTEDGAPGPLDLLERAFAPARMGALLLLVPPDRAIGHGGAGDFQPDAEGRLHRGPGLIYTGAQIIAPDLVTDLPPGPVSLNAAWDNAARQGRLFGLTWPGWWCDVGTPQAIPLAETLLAHGPEAARA